VGLIGLEILEWRLLGGSGLRDMVGWCSGITSFFGFLRVAAWDVGGFDEVCFFLTEFRDLVILAGDEYPMRDECRVFLQEISKFLSRQGHKVYK
jgi:hypothetical protein